MESFEKKNQIFLISLKEKNNGVKLFSYSWEAINSRIKILSNYLINIISKGDRCILLSENRPEWLISDVAIMNAGGVTVPLFTTYSENDYKYIIGDCEPKVCIVSNFSQFKKIQSYIKENTIIEITTIIILLVTAAKIIANVTSAADKGANKVSTIFPCIFPIIKDEAECENPC